MVLSSVLLLSLKKKKSLPLCNSKLLLIVLNKVNMI